MALFIDETYFTKSPLKIDSIDSSNGYSSNITNKTLIDFRDAIDEFEEEYLRILFGDDLYDEFVEDYNTLQESEEENPEDKWADLKALIFNETTKKSPIANYIFKKYIHRNYVLSIGDRQFKLKSSDNLISIYPSEKIKQAWNPSIKKNQKIFDYLYENFDSLDCENDLDMTDWDLLIDAETCLF